MKNKLLRNGVEMPEVGFGTWKAGETDGFAVLSEAIRAGYRHIDTASAYHTEEAVGRAVAASGVDRSEFFITTKAWKDQLGYDRTLAAFDASCQALGMDYLDLYLIHWPRPDAACEEWKELDRGSWRAMEELYRAGRSIELLACYDPAFRFMAEWWKQLYGESEGKEGKGLFPASVEFTADLHSMGQYIQEGQRLMCETVVNFAPKGEFLIPNDPENIDGLNFLAGKPLSFVAEKAMRGVMLAHVDGGVPNVLIQMPAISETSVGFLIYFFEYVCGLSGHLLEINPFNQPGVEAYKSNMFALLGKPGYEARQAELEARL